MTDIPDTPTPLQRKIVKTCNHDLRNPLGMVMNTAELLAMDEADPEKLASYELIRSQALAALDVVDNLTTCSRLDADALTLANREIELEELFELLERDFRAVIHSFHVDASFECGAAPEGATWSGDEGCLRLVVRNLCRILADREGAHSLGLRIGADDGLAITIESDRALPSFEGKTFLHLDPSTCDALVRAMGGSSEFAAGRAAFRFAERAAEADGEPVPAATEQPLAQRAWILDADAARSQFLESYLSGEGYETLAFEPSMAEDMLSSLSRDESFGAPTLVVAGSGEAMAVYHRLRLDPRYAGLERAPLLSFLELQREGAAGAAPQTLPPVPLRCIKWPTRLDALARAVAELAAAARETVPTAGATEAAPRAAANGGSR